MGKNSTLILIGYMVTLLFLTYSLQAQTKRNLINYKVGPTFDLADDFVGEAEKAKRNLRLHFWNAWNSKSQSYFKVDKYTREGQLLPCTYFIERSKNGSFQVVQECTGVCPYFSKKKCREFYEHFVTIFDKIEKIANTDESPSDSDFSIILTISIPKYSKYELKF